LTLYLSFLTVDDEWGCCGGYGWLIESAEVENRGEYRLMGWLGCVRYREERDGGYQGFVKCFPNRASLCSKRPYWHILHPLLNECLGKQERKKGQQGKGCVHAISNRMGAPCGTCAMRLLTASTMYVSPV
jgi:hypothetical protein